VNILLETLGIDFEAIVADRELEQYIVSFVIGCGRARQTGLDLGSGYQDIFHNRAARIKYRPANAASNLLSGHSAVQKKASQRNEGNLETDHKALFFPWRLRAFAHVEMGAIVRSKNKCPHKSALIIGSTIKGAIMEK
jgi:hypothetical protein